jgi:dTDP-4-dehydrorhamnose 3,5-epimerase
VKFVETKLPGVILVELDLFEDPRGYFFEMYHAGKHADGGIRGPFVQDNFSHSVRGTLRGLHYQLKHAQGKLVMALEGRIFDVAVDIRKGSPTFKQWAGVELSGESKRQLYIPPGFAHGKDERGIIWNDPALAIIWPIANPLLSKKDGAYKHLADMMGELPA